MFLFNHKKLIFGFISLIIIGFFVFQWYSQKTAKPVVTATVSRGNLSETLTLSGKIDADEKANVAFQSGGLVSWIGVKKGDAVKKNQAIASLDKRQLQNTLQQSLNTYMYNRDAFDQSIANTNGKVFTDDFKRTIDQAQQSMNNTVLNVELQTLVIQLATIYTPIDGIVTDLYYPYSSVNVPINATIATVVNPETIYFDVSADQTDVVNLSVGEQAKITLDAYPDTPIPAQISEISFTPKKDETGAVYQVKMTFTGVDNSSYRYKLGMTGDTEFVTKKVTNVLFVPSSFIKTDENSKRYVLKGEKKEKIFVTTGIDDGEKTEITGDITEGDIVYD